MPAVCLHVANATAPARSAGCKIPRSTRRAGKSYVAIPVFPKNVMTAHALLGRRLAVAEKQVCAIANATLVTGVMCATSCRAASCCIALLRVLSYRVR